MPKVAELKVGLLSYFVGTTHIYGLLLNQQGKSQVFQLMECEKAFPLINRLFEAMEHGYTSKEVTSVYQKFSFEWGKQLLPPSDCLKPFDVLVLIPHYTLHSLPFHIIWLEEQSQFLATSHGVSYCSSGTLFIRCVDRNPVRKADLSLWEFALTDDDPIRAPKPPCSCISIGTDIQFDKTKSYRTLSETFGSSFENWIRPSFLPRQEIKDYISSRKNSEPYEVICIVCHGYYDELCPENSGLLLENAWGEYVGDYHRPIYLNRGTPHIFRDRPFSYIPIEIELRPDCCAEIMTVSELKVDCDTEAQLVALFGCSTNAGNLLFGDDFGSLAYQWLKIGASSVLANLWESDLDFITGWSQLFIDNWIRKRQPKSIAWREALKQIMDNEPSLSPYKWGVVTLLGDWL